MNKSRSLISDFQWLVVPKGRTRENHLKLGLRIVPTVTTAIHQSDLTIRKLSKLYDSSAISDWPGFLAKDESVKLELVFKKALTKAGTGSGNSGEDCIDPQSEFGLPVSVDLSKIWKERLKELRLSGKDTSRLWKAICDNETKITPKKIDGQGILEDDDKNAKIEPSFNHSALTEATTKVYGDLYLQSVYKGLVLSGAHTANSASGRTGIESPLVVDVTTVKDTRELAELKEIYAPAELPATALMHQVAGLNRTKAQGGRTKQKYEYPDKPVTERSALLDLVPLRVLKNVYEDHTSRTVLGDFQDTAQIFPFSFGIYKKILDKNNFIQSAATSNSIAAIYAHKIVESYENPTRKGKDEKLTCREFHEIVGALQSYPDIMSRVGLSMDMEIELPDGGKEIDAAIKGGDVFIGVTSVTVVEEDNAEVCKQAIPSMSAINCNYKPRSRESKCDLYHQGCLNLNTAVSGGKRRFTIEQVDVDTSVEKLITTAGNLAQQEEAGLGANERIADIHAQTSKGLALLDKDVYKTERDAAAQAQKANENARKNGYLCLFEEDLVVGLRPDVEVRFPEQPGKTVRSQGWRSLVDRKVSRARAQWRDLTRVFEESDTTEGMVFATFREKENGNDLALLPQQELFTWTGWSLAVSDPAARKRKDKQDCDGSIGELELSYEVASELPKQRIGWEYRFGARLVYIDGSSLSTKEASEIYDVKINSPALAASDSTICSGEAVPFIRYEPVAPPDVHLRDRVDTRRFPLEMRKRVVVSTSRSRRRTARRSRRVLVPPRVSPDLAIRCGQFDDPDTRAHARRGAFAGVSLLPCGTFPAVGSKYLADASNVGGRSATGGEDTIYRRNVSASRPKIPYLPDPWAKTLVVAIYRAADNQLHHLEYHDYYDESGDHVWPNCRPLELDVIATNTVNNTSKGFDVEKTPERLLLKVLRAEKLKIRYWHAPKPDDLKASAIVCQAEYALLCRQPSEYGKLLLQALGITNQGSLELGQLREQLIEVFLKWDEKTGGSSVQKISAGKRNKREVVTSFWMLNGYEELDVVHAVDQPVRIPAVVLQKEMPAWKDVPGVHDDSGKKEQPFILCREPGEAGAKLYGHVRLDRKSTHMVSAVAHWVDNPGRPPLRKPKLMGQSAPLFTIDNISAVSVDDRGCLPDRPLGKDINAFSSTHQLIQALDSRGKPRGAGDQFCTGEDGGKIATTCKVLQGEKPSQMVFNPGRDEFKARALKVTVAGLSRFTVEYGQREAIKPAQGNLVRIIYPSSQPPRKPEVDSIMPLIVSTTRSGDDAHITENQPGWFRVWLKGEWYTSGNGELLALVCWPGNLFSQNGAGSAFRVQDKLLETDTGVIEPFVTRWGLDPIHHQSRKRVPFGNVPADVFRNRIRSLEGIRKSVTPGSAYRKVDIDHWADMVEEANWSPVINLNDVLVRDQVGGENSSNVNESTNCTLALYAPEFDNESRRWYVDVQIDPQKAYTPFMRLSLARYQPLAKKGCELSPILGNQWIQLMPQRQIRTRLLAYNRRTRRKTIHVAISGAAPERGNLPNMGRGNKVKLYVERLPLREENDYQHDFPSMDLGSTEMASDWLPVLLYDTAEGKKDAEGCECKQIEFDIEKSGVDEKIDVKIDFFSQYSLWIEEYETFETLDNVSEDCRSPSERLVSQCRQRLDI